jgi:hypothetical protein
VTLYKVLVRGKGPFSNFNYRPEEGKQVTLLTGIWLVGSAGISMWVTDRPEFEIWEVETPLGFTYVSKYASTAVQVIFKSKVNPPL